MTQIYNQQQTSYQSAVANQPRLKSAIIILKNNKSPAPDNIPDEVLKADLETSTQMSYYLIDKIWKDGDVPQDWKEGHFVKLPKKLISAFVIIQGNNAFVGT